MPISDTIVDKIYEAAIVPELWPDVLDEIAGLSKTVGGSLFAVTPQIAVAGKVTLGPVSRWTSSKSLESVFTAFLEEGWTERNIRGQRALEINHARFVNDHDLCSADEIETHPFYQFARGRGFGWATGVSIRVPTGDALIFNWERRFADGPIDRQTLALLDPLRGHLARSSLLASRLGLERARAMADTLEMLGLPSAVLCFRGRILAANDLLGDLVPKVLQDRLNERVHLSDRRADALFSDVLARAYKGDEPGPLSGNPNVLSVPISAKDDHPAMVVHIVPVRRAARDMFAVAASVLVITPVIPANVPDAKIIQGLFDLTAAEARVAHRISSGETVRQISVATQTAEGTIRNQLKSVFAKTGAAKQSDLVSLLGRVAPSRKVAL